MEINACGSHEIHEDNPNKHGKNYDDYRINKVTEGQEKTGFNKPNTQCVFVCVSVQNTFIEESRNIDYNAVDGEMVMTRLKTLIL